MPRPVAKRNQASSKPTTARSRRPIRVLAEYVITALAVLTMIGRQDRKIINTVLRGALTKLNGRMLLVEDSTESAIVLTQHNRTKRFTKNVQLNIDRGLNIINCWSGLTIASWVYHGKEDINPEFYFWRHISEEKLLREPQLEASKIQANDTIYVALVKLSEFISDFLPFIQNDFVLISGTWKWDVYTPGFQSINTDDLVSHPNLIQWFCTNIGMYSGGNEHHPKVSPFPLGLKANIPGALGGSFRSPIPTYRQLFLENVNTTTKGRLIFVGHLRDTNEKRRTIPSTANVRHSRYLFKMSRAHYVISPDGDHPDCHRHYEALGLGTIPITELDPFLYRHLAGGPVIFNNTKWDLPSLRANLPDPNTLQVNRNIVFEEYWMEHVEQVAGRALRWWDVNRERKSFLDEFALRTETTSLPVVDE